MRAAKLKHKIIDHSMEMQPIVKALVGKVNKVGSCNGHAVQIELGSKRAHGRVENSFGVWHPERF